MRGFFQKLREKDLILTFVLVGGFVIVVFVLVVLISIKENASSPSPEEDLSLTATPSPALFASLEEDYSRLNKVIPGKSTLNDVIKINGKPYSVSTFGDKTYLYYKTPLESFTNTVLVENDAVVYSNENVFGSYRGNVSDYSSKYGLPDITLFEKGDSYSWYVYLNEGIAIENDGKDVGTILYFIPQDKDSFMQTIARELNLVSDSLPEE